MEETKEESGKLDFFKNKKTITLISIVAIVILFALLIGIVVSKMGDKENVKYNGESNRIKYSAKMKDNSEVLVVMKNETGKAVSKLELIVTYFDKDGKELTKKRSTTDVFIKNDEITLNSVKSGMLDTDKIERYTIEIIPTYYDGADKQSNYEKAEILSVRDNNDNVNVTIKNKTEYDIASLVPYAVFFKDGLPISFYAENVENLKGEKELEFKKPVDDNGNKIEYDFCKVYIKY